MCPTELGWDESLPPCLRLLPMDTRESPESLRHWRKRPKFWLQLPLQTDNVQQIASTLAKVAEMRKVTVDKARAWGFWDEADDPADSPLVDRDGLVEVPVWRHALINMPHPLLRQGLVIVDTPGLNAVGAEPELALNLIPQAHAVVFLLAADTGVTRSDLSIWRDYLLPPVADSGAPGSLYFGAAVDVVEAARPVTLAVIQGGAYGGGTDLSLACDFRIGTPEANMFMPAVKLGLHFYASGMRRYVSRLGVDQAKRLFLTAERIDAQEMLRIGFLTELVPAEALQDRVRALSDALANMAPIALLGVKHHLNRIVYGDVDTQAIEAAVLQSEASEDMKEGALAWKEKRAPRFQGR